MYNSLPTLFSTYEKYLHHVYLLRYYMVHAHFGSVQTYLCICHVHTVIRTLLYFHAITCMFFRDNKIFLFVQKSTHTHTTD